MIPDCKNKLVVLIFLSREGFCILRRKIKENITLRIRRKLFSFQIGKNTSSLKLLHTEIWNTICTEIVDKKTPATSNMYKR